MTANPSQIADFINAVRRVQQPRLWNPYADYSPQLDISCRSRDVRTEQLNDYLCLRPDPLLILCAEATGYQGARFSGVPMMSERIVTGLHDIPHSVVLSSLGRRTSRVGPPNGFTEMTASIVWRAMRVAGINPFEVILTNTLMLHPHHPEKGPLSNRRPTKDELDKTRHLVEHFFSLYSGVTIVPIGRVAEQTLRQAGIVCQPYVRHPANGGAALFRQAMATHWKLCSFYTWP